MPTRHPGIGQVVGPHHAVFDHKGLLGLDYQPLFHRRGMQIRYERAPEYRKSSITKSPLYHRSKGSTLRKERGCKFFFLKFNSLEVAHGIEETSK